MLTARLAYSRLLFQRDPRAVAEAGYRAAVESGDEKLRGWAEYHWAVLLDHIDEDPASALPRYETALEIAAKYGDGYFESYIIRHLAPHKEPAERIAMMRRSLHLRAALGARPQTLAAQPSSPTTTLSAPSSCRHSAQVRKNSTSAGSCPTTDPPSAPARAKCAGPATPGLDRIPRPETE
ncbi:hypothetical protein OOK27_12830 [Streptomyces canus]|uniref:hypothetical protein n=1 Tax=Streptomyces canus TaxID=58343 RepID=UPI0022537190|nr:hypothetical protein [Streptomyces canus]MCX5255036.1 hypothetical protein [Streptomyces canus]